MGVIRLRVCVLLLLLVGCTRRVNECASDSDCTDVAYPFCDVKGEYGPSGGQAGVCTIVPPDCSVDRCGCSPGSVSCRADTLSTCNSDGHSTTDTACALGCAATNDRCLTFDPSNGLGAAMSAAGTAHAVTLDGVTIDTDSGVVTNSAGIAVPVASLQVSRSSGNIQAFAASSFTLGKIQVTGSLAIAFVSTGDITVNGVIDVAGSHGLVPGPGAQTSGACVGATRGGMGAGGGNATAGAAAHSNLPVFDLLGGSAQVDPVSLQGGCNGGGSDCTLGFGGGAIQLSSLSSITIAQSGLIDVGGGGGGNSASGAGCGGGSGGRVILEAPVVTLSGGVTANGGAGSACSMTGEGGKQSLEPAHGFTCPAPQSSTMVGGEGGTINSAPTDGRASGGGGGAVGRISVHTRSSTFMPDSGSLVSAALDSSPLAIH